MLSLLRDHAATIVIMGKDCIHIPTEARPIMAGYAGRVFKLPGARADIPAPGSYSVGYLLTKLGGRSLRVTSSLIFIE